MIRPGVIAVIGLAAAAAAAALALSLDRDDSDDTASLPNAAVFGPPSPDEAKGPAVTVARFGPTGDMMIAGRAIPEAQVVVRKTNLAGEVTEIGRIIADSRSEWVFVPDGPLAPGAWRIGVWSDRTAGPVSVVVAVPDGDPGALVALETPSNGPSRILKGGEDTPRPSILVVDRDENGRMAMAGRADPNAILHLYADNRFIGRTVADDHGDWQAAARTSKTGGR